MAAQARIRLHSCLKGRQKNFKCRTQASVASIGIHTLQKLFAGTRCLDFTVLEIGICFHNSLSRWRRNIKLSRCFPRHQAIEQGLNAAVARNRTKALDQTFYKRFRMCDILNNKINLPGHLLKFEQCKSQIAKMQENFHISKNGVQIKKPVPKPRNRPVLPPPQAKRSHSRINSGLHDFGFFVFQNLVDLGDLLVRELL
jgi:hypothetical protein